MTGWLRKLARFASKAPQSLKNPLATFLARALQQHSSPLPVIERPVGAVVSLYGPHGRKYLNAAERRRFEDATKRMPPRVRMFCLLLMWSGCRISEALAVTPLCIDLAAKTVALHSLKKRTRGIVRQVPLPLSIVKDLSRTFDLPARQIDPKLAACRLWKWHRSTGWRYVKKVMTLARVAGGMAMPKGLRHAFGVAAFETIPPHMVQRWLGHASLRTTAIYGEVSGPEERSYAARIWRRW